LIGGVRMVADPLRIVSLCASSSGCERNWSTFEFVSKVLKFHNSIE